MKIVQCDPVTGKPTGEVREQLDPPMVQDGDSIHDVINRIEDHLGIRQLSLCDDDECST